MQMAQRKPAIRYSIVIGARNEAPRIANSLDSLHAYLTTQNIEAQTEVIVVTTHGADQTPKIVKPYKDKFTHFVQIAPEMPVGKGRDIRLGMLAAHGDYVCFMDADMATPLHNLKRLFKALQTNPVVVGERNLRTMHHDWLRKVSSNVSHWLIRAMVGLRLKDTQCGFKGFQKKYVAQLFDPLITTGWGFDIEVLLRAKSAGLVITEFAISDWSDPKPAGSGLVGESQSRAMASTLKEVVAISYHRLLGDYLPTKNDKKKRGVYLAAGLAFAWYIALHITFLAGYGLLKTDQPNTAPLKPGIAEATDNFDGAFYREIAEKGYRHTGTIKHIAFYPLYPALLRTGHSTGLGKLNYRKVAFWLNLIFVLGTAILLYLVGDLVRLKNPLLAVLAWLAFPWSMFMGLMYTEALFCLLAVACMYTLLKGRYIWAICIAGLASATRLPGVTLGVVVGLEMIRATGLLQFTFGQTKSKDKGMKRLPLANLLLIPLAFGGLFAWLGYLWRYFGSPFAFREAYKAGWTYQVFNINFVGTVLKTVGKAIQDLKHHIIGSEFFEAGAWLSVLTITTVAFIKKLAVPWYWYVFICLNLALFTLNSTTLSVNRYCQPLMVIYPIAILLFEQSKLRHKGMLLAAALMTSFALELVFAVRFINAAWVG